MVSMSIYLTTYRPSNVQTPVRRQSRRFLRSVTNGEVSRYTATVVGRPRRLTSIETRTSWGLRLPRWCRSADRDALRALKLPIGHVLVGVAGDRVEAGRSRRLTSIET